MTESPAEPVLARSGSRPQADGSLAPADVVNAYLTAFYRADFGAVGPLLAADFAFDGPFARVRGRGAFLDSAQGLRPIVRGHRLLGQWVGDADVCSWYDVELQTPVRAGAVTMSEWHVLRGGQLAASRVVFDAAQFRSFLPPSG